MNLISLKKRIRSLSAKLGLYRTLRNLANRMRGCSNHSADELNFYKRFAGPGKLVFDVGANRGQSSEHFISLGAHVVAFEPQKELHAQILQLCGKSERLVIEGCALGDKIGEETLYLAEYDQVASMRSDWEGVRCGSTTIPVSTLDQMIKNHGTPDYCKIDAEGWELQVLSGLNYAIPVISFEYHASKEEMTKTRKVMERIATLGDYHANPKSDDGAGFIFPQPVPLRDFIDSFENADWISGYGDIFCSLDPSILASPVKS